MQHANIIIFSFTAKEKDSYDHIIINDDLEVAYEKLKGILLAVSILSYLKYQTHSYGYRKSVVR